MRGASVTFRRVGGVLLGAVVLLIGLCASPGVAAGPSVRPTAQLIPGSGFVTGGRNALYTGSWFNDGTATFTNVLITVSLPAGSSVLSTDPDVCTVSPPTDPAAAVAVSCPRDNLRSGTTFDQRVFFRAPVVGTETTAQITSSLMADEGTSDRDKAHTDTFVPDPEPLQILPQAADKAGGCLQPGDTALATQSGLSSANPLITTASLTGRTGQFCTPLTLVERHRSNPTELCGAGATCTTDISTTEAPLVPAPIQLTFTFAANNRNLTWYKTADDPGSLAEPVPSCPGATQLPVGLVACVNSRAKIGSAVTLGVLWQGGPDPSWVG